jgi:ATP-dependent Clp protease ATP-binding subunit ClpB
VLEIELGQVQKRVLDSTTCPFLFRITREGRESLLQEGTDQRYGARHLKRAIESNVLCQLSRLLATGQVRQGDVLLIDRHRYEEGLVFMRDKEKSSNPKIHFPMPNPRQAMALEAQV